MVRNIPIYRKLNPLWWFGNEDDGWCGEKDPGMKWWLDENCDGKCSIKCALKWFIRNPFHNFAFYVIGFADKEIENTEFWPKYPNKTLFVIRKVKDTFIRIPFFSFRYKGWEGYIGWRERGNFGYALRKYND